MFTTNMSNSLLKNFAAKVSKFVNVLLTTIRPRPRLNSDDSRIDCPKLNYLLTATGLKLRLGPYITDIACSLTQSCELT